MVLTDDEGTWQVTVRRWVTTTLLMTSVGAVLLALAPDGVLVRAAVTAPQALVDTSGPDALLVLLAWVLAVLCWAWGSLGLVLTGLSALPGLAGRVAGIAVGVLLPAGLQRAAALAVGVSLVAGPVVGWHSPGLGTPVISTAGAERSVVALPEGAVPDWPSSAPVPAPEPPAEASPVPDWPAAPPDGAHVVVRGDVLWDLAEQWLLDRQPDTPPTTSAIATAVQAWWQANTDVIGPDPDLLLPGQVLTPPAP